MRYFIIIGICMGALAGCVRFNTYYNAVQAYDEAEEMAKSRAGGSKPTAAEIDKLEKCLEKCGLIITRHPESGLADDALFLMAKALALKGEHVSAADKFHEVRRYFPESPHVSASFYLEARERSNVKRWDEASALVRTHLAESDEWDKWQEKSALLSAVISRDRGDCNGALDRLEAVLNQVDRKEILGPAYALQGECLKKVGRTAEAVDALNMADKSAPSRELRFRVRREKGEVLALLGREEEALETFKDLESIARADSELAQMGLSIGRSWISLGNLEKAEDALRNIIEAYPQQVSAKVARMELAVMLEKRRHDLVAALTEYEELSKQGRPRQLVEEAGRRAKALQDVERLRAAISDSSGDRGRSLLELGETFLLRIGLSDSALPYLTPAYADYPESSWAPRALYSEAWIRQERGDTLEASRLFDQLVNRYPSSAEARTILAARGEISQTASGKTAAQWLAARGETELLESEDHEQALRTFATVVDSYPLSPEAPRALWACAWISAQSFDDTAGARTYLEQLVARYPQTEEGKRASQELGTVLKPIQELPYDVPPTLVRIDTLECNELAPVDSLHRLGVVTVRVFIDSLGKAGEAELVKGTGSLLCDDAALYAARMADYEPAMKDSMAVAAWLDLAVPFIPSGEDSTGT